jgi:hypothetical protein
MLAPAPPDQRLAHLASLITQHGQPLQQLAPATQQSAPLLYLQFKIKFAHSPAAFAGADKNSSRKLFSKSGRHSEGDEFLRGQEGAPTGQEIGREARYPE